MSASLFSPPLSGPKMICVCQTRMVYLARMSSGLGPNPGLDPSLLFPLRLPATTGLVNNDAYFPAGSGCNEIQKQFGPSVRWT